MTVVGIGASTGALDALLKLLAKIPDQSGLTYVVVVHLSKSHKSILHEILNSEFNIPVTQVEGETMMQPDHIYVIPPGHNLNSVGYRLELSTMKQAGRSPIDHFFRSLANSHQSLAVGIVLTGTGADGTLGLREIRRRGGLAIVQDPNEAEQESMPLSAIFGGQVDAVLPLNKIPDFFLNYVRCQPDVNKLMQEKKIPGVSKIEIHRIYALVRTRTGHDLKDFNMHQALRSIRRRMKLHQLQKLTDYTEKIQLSPEEADALCRDLMFNMSHFFRQTELMHKLEEDILPQLIAEKENHKPLRIWVVGCSTGEDAYSLAILIREILDKQENDIPVQIFASDLYDSSLQKARDGMYAGNLHQDIGQKRLARFFIHDGDGYRVRPFLRDMMVFTRHTLLHDPPFSHIDLIYSGNLLHKLNPKATQEVLDIYYFSLSPSKYLVHDFSKVEINTDRFRPLSEGVPILQKIDGKKANTPVVFIPRMNFSPPLPQSKKKAPLKPAQIHEQMLLKEVSSLLINAQHEVLHVAGNAGRYLSYQAGELKLHLMSLLHPALRLPVKAALFKIMEQELTVEETTLPVSITLDGTPRKVTVSIKKEEGWDEKPLILLMFDELAVDSPDSSGTSELDIDIVGQIRENQDLVRILKNYEQKEKDFQATIEQQSSVNEELNTALEEIHSTYEELQSSNEALKDLQNENSLQVGELQMLSDDLHNLLVSTDLAILFLDTQLHIKRFTPKTQELFNLREEDLGRRITDQTHHLHYPELENDLNNVYQRLIPTERVVSDDQERWFLARVLPYLSGTNKIMGVVLSFLDITARREREQIERDMLTAEETARAKDEFLSTISHEIRTPLNAIVGLSDILLRKRPRKDQMENLESLQFAAQGLLRLVNDILDFSKLQAGKMQLESISYRPVKLLKSIQNAHLYKARDKKIRLRLDIDPDLPSTLLGDPHKLTQILHNLLSNAIKFTEKGEVKLKIRQERRESGEVGLLLCVRDTGIGISKEHQEYIFEKFSQADPTTMRRYGGTGLGLAIAQSLLQMMGSEIHLESKEGEGTRFFFRLKQGIGQEEVPVHKDTAKPVIAMPEKMRQARILLAEDVAINRMLMQQYLDEWWQVKADEATNGREALEKASEQRYDIILMDIRMPEMDGKEATRQIRKLNPHYQKIPIVALTADLSLAGVDNSQIRFDALVTKPFQPDELMRIINGLLEDKEEWKATSPEPHEAPREAEDEPPKDKLQPDLGEAEAPFEGMPDRKRRFFQMSIDAMEDFRSALPQFFKAGDVAQLEDVMHKQKMLFSMLHLDDFYQDIYQARQELEAGEPTETFAPQLNEIDHGLEVIIDRLQDKLQSIV